MTNELTIKPNEELIRQSAALTGTGQGNRLPYIPVLKINNKTEEKEVDVDGRMTKVKVPAKKGFVITTYDKETKKYNTKFFAEDLSAVILKVRYSINSKYNSEPQYYSDEFDSFGQLIRVYGKSREVIAEGNYKELKQVFKIGVNQQGNVKTSFDLNIILYIHLGEEVYRLKVKGDSRAKFFEYQNSFDTLYAGFKTNFNLKFNNEGEINYWYIDFEKGEDVSLAEELVVQKDIQKYFVFVDKVKTSDGFSPVAVTDEEVEQQMVDEESEEEINVQQIPF